MLPQELFFGGIPGIFEVDSVDIQSGRVIIVVFSKQTGCKCPNCKVYSSWSHSYYFRTVRDLPILGYNVVVNLRARKFYCRNDDCAKKVFSERFPDHFMPHSRGTVRLDEKLLKIALLMGGNPGKRLCDKLNIDTSSSSLIRRIHQKDFQPGKPSTHIGIDDWAYKKGHTYGTAIVDLKKRKIIDLLPDRETSSVESWLRNHSGVKIVTRDRYVKYAKGITNGAPGAKQVADRWHLLKNMGDATKKLLERKRQELRRQEVAKAAIEQKQRIKGQCSPSQLEWHNKTVQHPKFREIKKLHSQGETIRAIARIVGVSRITIRKYIHLDEPPRKSRPGSEILKFADYFKERIAQNPNIEVIQLWKEIREKGYRGGRSAVYEFLKTHTRFNKKMTIPFIPQQSWTPSKVSLLMYKDESELSAGEQKLLRKLKAKSDDIRIAHDLLQEFKLLMENKRGCQLNQWISKTMNSPVIEFGAFAKGLKPDLIAVKNAFSLPWSNGQVEGQINKLKTIKRQMYGRASFSLLRKRLLLASG
jgi:transposase